MEAAANNTAIERQISQIISNIEQGRTDQIRQSAIQTFFQVAPNGQFTEALLERAKKRFLARNRARLLGQHLIHDFDGDGAISSTEMESLLGSEASQLLSLRVVANTNDDGEISTEELLSAATAQAQKNARRDQFSYLMAFDLNDDDIVTLDEVLTAIRTLAGDDLTANSTPPTLTVTTGEFAEATNKPMTNEVVTTNSDGLPIELHMVGIYEPTTGRFPNPLVGKRLPVQIEVDRPGVAVTLALGSYEPAQWIIQTSEGIQIEKIIASSRKRLRSEFILNGEKVSVTFRDLPLAYQPRGNRCQPFHAAAAQAARLKMASSFNGAYKAPLEGFVFDEAPGVPTSAEVETALTA